MTTISQAFGARPEARPVGDTPLDAWLRAREITRTAFARELQVTHRTVQLWCNNQALPDLVNSFRIQHATDGGVTPEMWLGTDLARFLWKEVTFNWEVAKEKARKNNRVQARKRPDDNQE